MKILSFGSLNLDGVYHVQSIVKPGETISSKFKQEFCGGKGLNQAIAAARAGMQVFQAGGIGSNGGILLKMLKDSQVDVSLVQVRGEETGHTIIQVDPDGANAIIVCSGANHGNTEAYIKAVLSKFEKGDYVILQNEIDGNPLIVRYAHERGMKVVINPSPFDDSIASLCAEADMLFLNEHEAYGLVGKKDARDQLLELHHAYPDCLCVLTLGEKGSACVGPDGIEHWQCAFPAETVDTTAAGDTFTGYYLAAYCREGEEAGALRTASMASSIAVSRQGAAPSIPCYEEVEKEFKKTAYKGEVKKA